MFPARSKWSRIKLGGLFSIMILIAASFSAASAQASVIFSDDFNNGAKGAWSNHGNWVASGGTYNVTSTNPGYIPNTFSLVNGHVLTDFRLTVDVGMGNSQDPQEGGIWLRSATSANNAGVQGVFLVFARNEIYWHVVTPDESFYGPSYGQVFGALDGSAFSLEVVVQGNLYQAYLNGNSNPITTLNTDAFSSGLAGLYSSNLDQNFDNFVVSTVPIPAALPLFGSAMAILGFLGWRRKGRAEPTTKYFVWC